MKLEAVYETENSIYLIMELMEGGEIFSNNNPQYSLTSEEKKHLTRQLLEAVSELQRKKVVHRDIKPGNIMFKYAESNTCRNEIKLIDFGLATQVNGSGYNLFSICGTPGYIAPEVVNLTSEKIETASPEEFQNCDVFSVGAMMFALLTGS